MWYNQIPQLSFPAWLAGVVQLVDDTLRAILGLPVLALFLVFPLLLALLSFWAALLRRGRKGGL